MIAPERGPNRDMMNADASTRQKDETATPGAAGVSSSRHSSRAPENHWRIKISLPVGEILTSPDQ